MDDERLVVEVEKYVELYDQSSRHYKDNSKKDIAWRAIALEIGSSETSGKEDRTEEGKRERKGGSKRRGKGPWINVL
ncbi:unnamed protein product [Arctogadus glacialis]